MATMVYIYIILHILLFTFYIFFLYNRIVYYCDNIFYKFGKSFMSTIIANEQVEI